LDVLTHRREAASLTAARSSTLERAAGHRSGSGLFRALLKAPTPATHPHQSQAIPLSRDNSAIMKTTRTVQARLND
jgi:hypothetical protein